MTITVQGDYDEIQRLAENLEDLPRAYLVSSLTLDEILAVGDVATLATLLAEGADVTVYAGDGFTPLHLAAFFDSPYAAGLLLRSGADPEAVAVNLSAVRPLHSAVAGPWEVTSCPKTKRGRCASAALAMGHAPVR